MIFEAQSRQHVETLRHSCERRENNRARSCCADCQTAAWKIAEIETGHFGWITVSIRNGSLSNSNDCTSRFSTLKTTGMPAAALERCRRKSTVFQGNFAGRTIVGARRRRGNCERRCNLYHDGRLVDWCRCGPGDVRVVNSTGDARDVAQYGPCRGVRSDQPGGTGASRPSQLCHGGNACTTEHDGGDDDRGKSEPEG